MTAYRIVTKHGPSPLGAVWRAKVEKKRRWFGWKHAGFRTGVSADSESAAITNALALMRDPDYRQDFGTPSHKVKPTFQRGVLYLDLEVDQ